jgi:hypothetical protein
LIRSTASLRPSSLARRLAVLAATGAVVLASCQDATAVRVHVYTDVTWQSGRRVVIAAANETPPSPSEPLAEITEPWSSTDLGDFVLLPSGSKRAPIRLAVVMGITKDPRACTIDAPDGCIFVRRKLGRALRAYHLAGLGAHLRAPRQRSGQVLGPQRLRATRARRHTEPW